MNFNQLKSIIDSQGSGNLYVLLGTEYLSDSISDLFRHFCPDGKFTLDRATRHNDDTLKRIILQGYLKEEFLGFTDLVAEAEFSLLSGAAQLKLSLTGFPTDWKLSQTFPSTLDSIVDEFHYLNPTFILDSQVPESLDENFQTAYNFPVDKPATDTEMKHGLHFKADIVRADIPESLRWMLASNAEPYLTIAGPIMIKFGWVQFLWRSAPVSFSLSGTDVPLALHLAGVSPEHAERGDGWTSVRHFALLSSACTFQETGEDDVVIPIWAVVPQSEPISISLAGASPTGADLDISTLAGLMGGAKLSDAIPDSFPVVDDIVLQTFGFEFELETKSLSGIWFQVGFNETWSLFEDWFTVEDMRLLFNVFNPLSSPMMSVVVFGTLSFGAVDLELRMGLNDLSFQANLQEGEVIPLTQLFDSLIGLPNGFPEIKGTGFYIEGNISENQYIFSSTLESDWQIDIGGNKLGIEKLSLELSYQGKTASQEKGVSGRFFGQIKIAGAVLYVSARLNEGGGWDFSGGTMGDSEISLTAVVNELAQLFGLSLPNATPDVSLKNLYLSFNTKSKTFQFIGDMTVPGTIPLAGQSFDLQTRINLSSAPDPNTSKRSFSGYIEATLNVGNSDWLLRYEMGTSISKVSASWRAIGGDGLGLDDILDTLGVSDKVDIPNDLDANLMEIALEYDVQNQFVTLSGRTKSYGDAFLTVARQDGKWAFVFGINITPTGGKVSNLPVVGQYLQPADFFSIKQAGIMISSAAIQGYSIPALPVMAGNEADPGSDQGRRPAQPVAASTPLELQRGFSTVVVLQLGKRKEPVVKNLTGMLSEATLPFQLSYSTTGVSFYAALGGSIPVPGKNNPWFTIHNPAVRITRTTAPPEIVYQVMGGFSFRVFGEDLTVTLSMILETDSAAVAVSMEADEDGIPGPPGLKGLRLIQLGMLMGVGYTPPSITMALQGKFRIGDAQRANNEMALALEIIEKVPNPLYLSFYMEEVGFDELVTLVTDKPAGGALEVLSQVQGYDLSLYWCTKQVTLPDGTIALPGFGFSGQIKFFGFGAYGEFSMMVDKGIKGHAEIAPLNLGNVLKISGGGKGIRRTYELVDGNWELVKNNTPESGNQRVTRRIVKPGGAVIQFDPLKDPLLDISWKVSLFDTVESAVEATVSTAGISFMILYAISGALQVQFTCQLADWSKLDATGAFSFDLDLTVPSFKINGVNVGSLRVQARMEVGLTIALSASSFSMGVQGNFSFQGLSCRVNLNYNTAPSSLTGMVGWLEDEVIDEAETLFASLFADVEEYINMIGDGILDVGNAAMDGLANAYTLTADEFADAATRLGESAEAIGNYMKNTLGYGAEVVSDALQRAGQAAKDVWNFMQNSFNWFSHVDVNHTDRNAESYHGDVSQRFHADKKKHFDLKLAGKKVHADVGKTLGIDQKVNLTPHVDVPHMDRSPSYNKQHLDLNGVNIPKHRYGGQKLSSSHVDQGVGKKVKFSKYKKHLDLGHLDEQMTLTVPKAPSNHVDVGHVDVKANLPAPDSASADNK